MQARQAVGAWLWHIPGLAAGASVFLAILMLWCGSASPRTAEETKRTGCLRKVGLRNSKDEKLTRARRTSNRPALDLQRVQRNCNISERQPTGIKAQYPIMPLLCYSLCRVLSCL
jgi:hypothetical protein